ncbi:MAG: 3-deoxy-manno-octulosonate cytidylyltransferase [Bacteroidales bacterium]|nr:3-deoxy-manno-octulosonate cytidylyltransferase [Bacteroidales bacterium]
MKFIGIIPARYQSTRFPGKPLVSIHGKTMIQRVYERTSLVLKDVIVATDDNRIEEEVKRFGGQVVMTADTHRSGTDRCAEALDLFRKQTGQAVDIVINIQGDEPLIRPEQLQEVMALFEKPETAIATLVHKHHDLSEILNPNDVKAVLDKNGKVLYFSRSPIPYQRNIPREKWATQYTYYIHIGMYAYRTDTLSEITRLAPSPLEKAESLEQNRWLENGYAVMAAVSPYRNYSVDTPEDLRKILHLFD